MDRRASGKQIAGWRTITDFAHRESAAKIGVQLGHAGARGATQIPQGNGYDVPLEEGGWPLLSASAKAWRPGGPVPAAMTQADMDRERDAFAAAARRADAAGFDLIEVQAGHGFLLSSFVTPLMNDRNDVHGSTLAARLGWPVAVVRAVRAAWPAHKPLAVRISAHDWQEGGIRPEDAVEIAAAFVAAGADIIDVSSGETSFDAKPVFGRLYQTPFSDRIRNEAQVATMAVGNIYETDHVNSILASGRADLVALGRPHLVNPMWTLHAAAELGYRGVHVPAPYSVGQAQLAQNKKRAADALIG